MRLKKKSVLNAFFIILINTEAGKENFIPIGTRFASVKTIAGEGSSTKLRAEEKLITTDKRLWYQLKI